MDTLVRFGRLFVFCSGAALVMICAASAQERFIPTSAQPLERKALQQFLAHQKIDVAPLDLAALEPGLLDGSRVYRVAAATTTSVVAVAASRVPKSSISEHQEMIERAIMEHCRLAAVAEAVALLAAPKVESRFNIRDPALSRSVTRYAVQRQVAAFLHQDRPCSTEIVDSTICVLIVLERNQVDPVATACIDSTAAATLLADFATTATTEGYRLLAKGENRRAYPCFEFAELANPDDATPMPGLLACHLRCKRLDEFARLAQAIIDNQQMTAALFRQSGRLCEDAQMPELAISLYSSALRKSPDDDEAEMDLVRLYVSLTASDRTLCASSTGEAVTPTTAPSD